MSINSVSYSLPPKIEDAVHSFVDKWTEGQKTKRIWEKDATIWTGGEEADWLGWLSIIDEEFGDVTKYSDLRADIEQAGFTNVLLMGMGGSSLCPEVLALTFGIQSFHILDSTDPAQVKSVEDKLDIAKTLFIVASKSGSTLEPNCFKQYFFDRVSQISDEPGKQFVAITDPGSKMEQIAKNDGFRYIFYGKPQIGGRFSALSAFGLTAAAAMGLDTEMLLLRAAEMAELCKRADAKENPGALLGIVLGTCHSLGRDKLTIYAASEVHDLGAWMEQLVAESTGKKGVAIIPVDREPIVDAENYYNDRVFVHIGVKGHATDEAMYRHLEALERAGHPMVRIELDSIYHVGQEFFRWEFATAIAGSLMGIDPFNQPDVEAAKIEARKITDEYGRSGSLPAEKAFFEEAGISLFTDEANASALKAITGDDLSIAGYLNAHISRLGSGDYFALLAYIEMNSENDELLQAIRRKVLDKELAATCLGFGPRFLHSTGQAYKGGADNGVFLQITCDDAVDLDIPGEKFTFGVVKAAQARGDFQVLLDRGRRALRLHFGSGLTVKEGLAALDMAVHL